MHKIPIKDFIIMKASFNSIIKILTEELFLDGSTSLQPFENLIQNQPNVNFHETDQINILSLLFASIYLTFYIWNSKTESDNFRRLKHFIDLKKIKKHTKQFIIIILMIFMKNVNSAN
jgi:hypothetical protein